MVLLCVIIDFMIGSYIIHNSPYIKLLKLSAIAAPYCGFVLGLLGLAHAAGP